MTRQKTPHQDNIEECKNIFVPWKWLVGILIPIIGVGGGGEWLSSRAMAKQEVKHESKYRNIDDRFKSIESQIGASQAASMKADTIIKLLKTKCSR